MEPHAKAREVERVDFGGENRLQRSITEKSAPTRGDGFP